MPISHLDLPVTSVTNHREELSYQILLSSTWTLRTDWPPYNNWKLKNFILTSSSFLLIFFSDCCSTVNGELWHDHLNGSAILGAVSSTFTLCSNSEWPTPSPDGHLKPHVRQCLIFSAVCYWQLTCYIPQLLALPLHSHPPVSFNCCWINCVAWVCC